MWYEIDDALEGSLRCGKSRGGRKHLTLRLELSERAVYQLQRLLEELAAPVGEYFKIRQAVLLSEELREAVVRAAAAEETVEHGERITWEGGSSPRGG